jgi:hypothetical protein
MPFVVVGARISVSDEVPVVAGRAGQQRARQGWMRFVNAGVDDCDKHIG